MPDSSKRRLLIFIVAYNARRSIANVLSRIPPELTREYEGEILIIDDASNDHTFEEARSASDEAFAPYKVRVLENPINQGYGGNQKIGYWYALENNFDYVALVHGDGQYAPERLMDLLLPVHRGEADAVLGSRMLTPGAARAGGMPLYKYIGNKVLTRFQNRILGTAFSEFHSGYRVYRVAALRKIPFDLNTNGFHFDTEIILQLLLADQRIVEIPIPTYYGDEISHVNGMAYAANVVAATLKARMQSLNIFYDRKFDCTPGAEMNSYYRLKLSFRSPHSLALKVVKPNTRVLDLGCAGGYLGRVLTDQSGCSVLGVDQYPLKDGVLDDFIVHDLDSGPPEIDLREYEYILLLDVIEHLKSPEGFIQELRQRMRPDSILIVSTANIAFILTRLSLLFGNFNYGKRGILDLTHMRLFTFASLKRLFGQANFDVLEVMGTPLPFPFVFGPGSLARAALAVNTLLLKLLPTLFSFQAMLVVQPRPTLAYLLTAAEEESRRRAQAQDRV